MKRFISLSMAAACALSMAVPAFAAFEPGTEEWYKDSGYSVQTVVEFGSATAAGSSVSVTVGNRNITVKADGGLKNYQVAETLAREVDKVAGFTAEIRYGDTKKEVENYKAPARVYEAVGVDAGKVEVVILKNATQETTNLNKDFDQLTLNDIFISETVIKNGTEIRALFETNVKNDDDGVLPNKTMYFIIRDQFYKPSDIQFELTKAEGSKYIKSIKDTQKSFDKGTLVDVDGTKVEVAAGRYRVLEVKLKENMTDDEYKLLFNLRVKVKKDGFNDWAQGSSLKFDDIGETWVSNNTVTGDSDWAAGTGGVMIKPQKNEDNEIIWYDENRDIAKVEFYADSDTDKFFVKLSTKWNNEWYSDMFRNTDAFIFNFVGAPKISATSRSTLTIYNPFVNEDDELEVDLDELKVYKVLDTAALAATTEEAIAEAIADGRIEDVTNLFTAGENEDGDQVLTTRTRDLGTYIVTTATPADLVDDVVVDSTNNGKVNPGTGR